MTLRAEYVAVKVYLLELFGCRMLMWEHFPQHLYTVNIVFYTYKELKMTSRRVNVEMSSWKWYRRPLCATENTIGKPSIHVINLCIAGSPLTIMGPESETTIPVIRFADTANDTFGTK